MKLNYIKTLFVVILVIFATTANAETYSGTWGDNLNWSLDTESGLLKITGSGEMEGYSPDELFYNKFTIISIEIENGVTSIGNSAFEYCNNLTSVTIPESVTSIGNMAFNGCNNLTSVTIPESVTFIGDKAFNSCYNLTTVTIPNSVTHIGEYAFSECTALTSINVSENNPKYSSKDGVLYNKTKTELIQFPGGKGGEYIIPGSVTIIKKYAFLVCSDLTSVTIPNSVTTIEEGAFEESGITSVTIPNSVTYIGEYAFCDCNDLTSLTIKQGITTIEERAFEGCYNLTTVTIPNSVTHIGEYAFSGCAALSSINVSENNLKYSSKDGVLYNKSKTELIQCPEGKEGEYIIPNSVITIKEEAFSGCSFLTSVTIPNSVTTIEEEAFSYCINLTTVTIPNSVTHIGGYAFGICI